MAKKIVIIGAGLAGLSCAFHLKKDYEIFEKEGESGGLCRSKSMDGFTFDFAGHLLHFKTQYVYDLVKRLLGKNLVRHTRSSYIFSKDIFSPYPFQANTYCLPKKVIKECLIGLASNGKSRIEPKDFHEWMVHKFGKGIVKHFMLPYNHKFWRTHPRNLTCEWLDGRIPQPSLKDSIAGAFENNSKPWGYNFHFWYPKKGGISSLPKEFEKRSKQIYFNHEVKHIDIKKRIITFNNSFKKKYDYLITSIPLAEIGKITTPIPAKVKAAIKKLKFVSIFNLNLGVPKHCLGDKNWIYFPEKKFIFYRIGSFSSFSQRAAPASYSSLYVEASYSNGSYPESKNGLMEKVERDLTKLNLISDRSQIVSRCANDIKYGYITYDRNYSKARKNVIDFLNRQGIFSIGRFGSWRYLSMEESILDGKKAAEILN